MDTEHIARTQCKLFLYIQGMELSIPGRRAQRVCGDIKHAYLWIYKKKDDYTGMSSVDILLGLRGVRDDF